MRFIIITLLVVYNMIAYCQNKTINIFEAVNYKPDSIVSLFYPMGLDTNDYFHEKISAFKNIEHLRMTNASKFPESIFNLKKIEYLIIEVGSLTKIPNGIGKLESLKRLYILYNEINYISKDISNLKNLEVLLLSWNKISLMPKNIKQLKSLKNIFLDYNDLKDFPLSLLGLNSLEILVLSVNKIEIIPKEITKLKKLRILDLERNNIKRLPISISQMSNLERLVLVGNPIKKSKIEKLRKKLPNCEVVF